MGEEETKEEVPTETIPDTEGEKVGLAMRIAGVEVSPEDFDKNPKAQIERASEILNVYGTIDQLKDVYKRTIESQKQENVEVKGTMTTPPRNHPLTKVQAEKDINETLEKMSLEEKLGVAHYFNIGPFDPNKYARKRRIGRGE
jgi:hypothetical protein